MGFRPSGGPMRLPTGWHWLWNSLEKGTVFQQIWVGNMQQRAGEAEPLSLGGALRTRWTRSLIVGPFWMGEGRISTAPYLVKAPDGDGAY